MDQESSPDTMPLEQFGSDEPAEGQNIGQGEDEGQGQGHGVRMERNVGLGSGIGLIVGTIIGSGIFISPKGVMEGSGSVGMTLILWVVCGALATMGALVYAELGSTIPQSGSEHAYLSFTFNRPATSQNRPDGLSRTGQIQGGIGRVPVFLYDWVALLIIRPTMFSALSLALGTYAVKPFFPDCDPPVLAVKLVTAVAMGLTGFLNCYSVKMATRVQNVCTFTKVSALAIIALGGIVQLCRGIGVENFEGPFEDTSSSPSTLAVAFYNGLWAFEGWNSLNFVTEEIKNPARNLPLAIMIGIPMTTLCYVLANVGYLAIMSKPEILQSHAVAVRWGEVMLGQYLSWLMPVFVIVSTFSSANGCLFASGRLSYVAGRDGYFPRILGFISVKRLTPVPAVICTIVIATCLLIPGDLGLLIDIFIFSSWLFYGWATISLLILRYKDPRLHRPYKVPLVVPIVVLLACAYLLLAPFIQNPGGAGAFTLLILLLGLIAYIFLVHKNLRLPKIDSITSALQKLLHVAPTNS